MPSAELIQDMRNYDKVLYEVVGLGEGHDQRAGEDEEPLRKQLEGG